MTAPALSGEDIVALAKTLVPVLIAIIALIDSRQTRRVAKESARRQIHFALEDAVNSGAISAPDTSPLRENRTAAPLEKKGI